MVLNRAALEISLDASTTIRANSVVICEEVVMQYKLIPFEPPISTSDPTKSATEALKRIVDSHSAEGWQFKSLENHSTVVPGSSGCFGFGATSPYPKTISIAVFVK